MGGFGILWIADAFIMCLCIDCLRKKTEIKVCTGADSSELDLSIHLKKKADGDRFRKLLNSSLERDPRMSKSTDELQSHHIQMKCPFERCKKKEGKRHFSNFLTFFNFFNIFCSFFFFIALKNLPNGTPMLIN